MNGKKILVTIFVVFCVLCGLALTWGYFTRDANSVAIGTIGGLAGAIVGGGYLSGKRKESTTGPDASTDAHMARDSIQRTKDIVSEIKKSTDGLGEIASGVGDVADKLDTRARDTDGIVERVRRQIEKNKMGT
jgi:hypothetical protein